MKKLPKILVFVLISLFCLKSNAQTFGIKGGLSLATMLEKDNDTTVSNDYKMKPGIHFGITANIPLNSYLSVESGLIVTNKGFQIEVVSNGNGYLGRISLYYIEVPITLRASHKLNDEKIIPLYSYLSKAKGMNVRWVLGCKAENPDLTITKIGSFYFPNFVE
jgi:hypothetical protein